MNRGRAAFGAVTLVSAVIVALISIAVMSSPSPQSMDGGAAMGQQIVFVAAMCVSAALFIIAVAILVSSFLK